MTTPAPVFPAAPVMDHPQGMKEVTRSYTEMTEDEATEFISQERIVCLPEWRNIGIHPTEMKEIVVNEEMLLRLEVKAVINREVSLLEKNTAWELVFTR